MARVYSTNFLRVGTYSPGFPPPPFTSSALDTCVVREMTWQSAPSFGDGSSPAFSVIVGDLDTVIWEISFGDIWPGRTYMWEGREVFSAGESLTFVGSIFAGGSFSANGYVLTTAA